MGHILHVLSYFNENCFRCTDILYISSFSKPSVRNYQLLFLFLFLMWAKVDNSFKIYYMLKLLLENDTTRTGHNEVIVLSEKNKIESFVGILLISDEELPV